MKKHFSKIYRFLLVIAVFIPNFIYAGHTGGGGGTGGGGTGGGGTGGSSGGLGEIVATIGEVIGTLTPIVVALALLFFFWGLAKYILAAGDESKKAEGRSTMIWGVIALFVIVSVWGLVQVLQQTFLGTTSPDGTATPPSVDTAI